MKKFKHLIAILLCAILIGGIAINSAQALNSYDDPPITVTPKPPHP